MERAELVAATSDSSRESAASVAEPGLPLAHLHGRPPATSSRFVVTTIDGHGRVSDRSSLRFLGWHAGDGVKFSLTLGGVQVTPFPGGRHVLTGQGHLHLPVAIRCAHHLRGGDRLLIGAFPDQNLLAMFTMAAVEDMLRRPRPSHPHEGTGR